ncbi:MAG: alpha/beta fold hydrolase [Ruthenibacterium lactatiformans]
MIDRKCKVTLGGLPQKIHVKGDETKPVLLFLHGGPGVCNRHTVMTVHADLQKEFLVVAWDQRGSGGSYRGAAVETLTIDRLVDDAHELVLWLCREYGRKRCTCWAAAGARSWAHGWRTAIRSTLRPLWASGRSSMGRKTRN